MSWGTRTGESRAEERKMKKVLKLRSPAGGAPLISDMRIVLLGNRWGGKSSSGNTILGREEFDTSGKTAECVKREGETAGRHITVVEAPGWYRNFSLVDTPERDKQEIVLSVSLCPPGPHAVLLVINAIRSFTETHRKTAQEHLELLSERVWSHTIVLFTRGDQLGNTTIEQHIEREGKSLQWVVEKCGNRYHVVENKKSDGGQVTELLEKIEEMVTGNRGHHFDGDAKIMKELMMKKKEDERRAEERKMKVQKHRETLRSSGGAPLISDMRIVLLGNRGEGKSSSGNTILGSEEFDTSGKTAECVKREGETAGRNITVVEAPGWYRNYSVVDTPERVKQEIFLSVSLCPPGPHAVLLVIDATESFTERHRRAAQEHLELLGERVWSHTIVLFTYGDWLGNTTIEQHIEREGKALQRVVEKCGNRYHVIANNKSDGGQVTELLEKIEEMVAGNSGGRSMDDRPNFKEGLPEGYSRGDAGYDSSKSGLESGLIKSFNQLSAAGSAQGFGQQKPPLRPEHGKAPHAEGKFFARKVVFVDESIITVNHDERIGRGSYGTVYRGSYQGTPAAVKMIEKGHNPVITNELIVPCHSGEKKIEERVAGNSGGRSMDDFPNFKEGVSNDYSREDAGYASSKSGLASGLIKHFKQQSAAGSAQGSGQQKPPLRPEHRKAQCAVQKVLEKKVPFVDESKITVNDDERVGRGSYGTVYRGSYQQTPAAVKMIEIGDNPVITNEFTIPGHLSHPNIVRMIAVARSETHILIANQYIHGANLQEVLYKDTPVKLQDEDKLFVALDIAMAVEYIHGKQIIHQDLKPANIMIAADTRKAYLTDWGLANLKETVVMTRGGRQSGALCGPLGGTPPYMAPECLVECEACSTMSDMWSLGITLLEMFTNSKVWSYSSLQELRKLLYNKKTPLALPTLQPALHDIVKPLLEYEPESRMNANDLVKLLKSKVDLTKRYGYKW